MGRIEAIEDRWERMVLGSPWGASCTGTVAAADIETCSGPEAAEHLTHGAFGKPGALEGRFDRKPIARTGGRRWAAASS